MTDRKSLPCSDCARRIGFVHAGLFLSLLAGCPLIDSIDDGAVNEMTPVVTENRPPVANAGDDQIAASRALVVLDAGQSSDPDFDLLSFIWRQVGGTPLVSLQGSASSRPQFVAPTVTSETVLTFRLTVADGLRTSVDEMTVTVRP